MRSILSIKVILTCLLFLAVNILHAQVGLGTTTPASSAALDISSTSKGLLPPLMTYAQILEIQNPVAGLTVYDLSAGGLRLYDGRSWQLLSAHGDATLQDAPGFFNSVPVTGATITSMYMLPNKNLLIASNASIGAIISGITIPTSSKFFGLLDSNGVGLWMKSIPANIFSNIDKIKADAKKEMERQIGLLGKKVSNIGKCIDTAIKFSSKLATVWASGDYRVKREIQDLVFPGGMYYNRQKDLCRTGRVNEVLSCIAHQKGILAGGNSNSGSVFDVNYDRA